MKNILFITLFFFSKEGFSQFNKENFNCLNKDAIQIEEVSSKSGFPLTEFNIFDSLVFFNDLKFSGCIKICNDKRLRMLIPLLEGKVHGNVYGYHENGNLSIKWSYLNGVITNFEEYDTNGILSVIGNYLDGSKNGLWLNFYSNGKIKLKENFVTGQFEGNWICYYDNGKIYQEGQFLNFKKEGKWIIYNYNGLIAEEQYWHIGVRSGIWIEYDEKAKVLRQNTYSEGVVVNCEGDCE